MQTEVQPMVNQIEYHPGYLQREIVDYCRAHEFWSKPGVRSVADACLRILGWLPWPNASASPPRSLHFASALKPVPYRCPSPSLPNAFAQISTFSALLCPRTSLPKSRHSRNSAFPGKIRTKSHSDGSSKKDRLASQTLLNKKAAYANTLAKPASDKSCRCLMHGMTCF